MSRCARLLCSGTAGLLLLFIPRLFADEEDSKTPTQNPESQVDVARLLARADAGDPAAQNALGVCYLNGKGVVRNGGSVSGAPNRSITAEKGETSLRKRFLSNGL